MRRGNVTLRRIAAVVTVTAIIAACSPDALRHVGAADLLFTDEGPPILRAAYLFDGDLSDAEGGTTLEINGAEFGEDRAGNGSGALYWYDDVGAVLPEGALPRTLSVWVRIPDLSDQVNVDYTGLSIGLQGQPLGSEEWEQTELKLGVNYSTWTGDAYLSYQARVRFEASGGYLESEQTSLGNRVGRRAIEVWFVDLRHNGSIGVRGAFPNRDGAVESDEADDPAGLRDVGVNRRVARLVNGDPLDLEGVAREQGVRDSVLIVELGVGIGVDDHAGARRVR